MKVVKIIKDGLRFDDGTMIYSDHDQDCCESHWLSLDDYTVDDFEGLEFDLSRDDFFERIEDYGIALLPLNGHPIRIPGYGSNNGYYSSNLSLVVEKDGKILKSYNISECQDINY